MFDFFRKHTRVLQFVLVLLIFPSFVFFGVRGYSGSVSGDNQTVAEVAGQSIKRGEWEVAQREQIERVRRQMPNADPKMFDTPEMKLQSLDAMVRERVMLVAADKLGLVTTDDRLQRLFAGDPQFAFLRNPDGSVNKDALAAQGMSSEVFAQRLRQELSMRQVLLGVGGTVLAPVSATAAALDAMLQQREVQVQRFDSSGLRSKVAPTDADIEKYFKEPANAAQFQAPEEATVEFVLLDLDALKKDLKVSDDELHHYYDQNIARYSAPPERRASHILIKADKGAPPAERDKARAKAESLLAELKKNPSAFAELARKNSADPGSAEKGGDLDFFGRGAMVKPFDDAVFSLQPGQMSGVVESDFGFHIILLTAVRGGDTKAFESLRGDIENEVKTQMAQKRFAEVASEFTNTVYEQSESLKPAAEKYKLDVKTVQKVTRAATPAATGPLANPKFLAALFADDALKKKRNTEAIEIAPNQLVSGRVVQYTPAHPLALADVRSRVRDTLVGSQATAMARQLGEARLAALRAAPATALDVPTQIVSRAQAHDLPRPLVDAILKAPASALPAFVGVDLGAEGYAVAKVTRLLGRDPVAADATQAQAQYAQTWADAESQAYYAALKKRFGVEIHADALNRAPTSADDGGSVSK